MNWKWQTGGVTHKVLALAGNDPPTKHMLMCGLAISNSVPGRARGSLGWRWDLSCHPSIKFSRKYTWVDGDFVHFPLISKHFRKVLFFSPCFTCYLQCFNKRRKALHQPSTCTGSEPASAGTVAATDQSCSSLHYYVWLPTSINYSIVSTVLAASYSLC